jgi:hypothetical protein
MQSLNQTYAQARQFYSASAFVCIRAGHPMREDREKNGPDWDLGNNPCKNVLEYSAFVDIVDNRVRDL